MGSILDLHIQYKVLSTVGVGEQLCSNYQVYELPSDTTDGLSDCLSTSLHSLPECGCILCYNRWQGNIPGNTKWSAHAVFNQYNIIIPQSFSLPLLQMVPFSMSLHYFLAQYQILILHACLDFSPPCKTYHAGISIKQRLYHQGYATWTGCWPEHTSIHGRKVIALSTRCSNWSKDCIPVYSRWKNNTL